MSLTEELAVIAAGSTKRFPPEVLAVMEQAAAELDSAGIGDKGSKAGDLFPLTELLDAHGKSFDLEALLAKGPVVVNFYRGGWCPYCNLELKAYQDMIAEFRVAGAELVAISPERPDLAATTAEKNAVTYPVLTDPQNQLAGALGIVFDLPVALKDLYEKFGNNLPDLHGEAAWRLPVPATYLVGSDRRILAAHVARDYRTRAEPGLLLEALTKNATELA